MSLASTLAIGSITTTPYDFTASKSAPSGVRGFRSVTFSGTLEIALADTIEELTVNPAARRTIGGVTGALAYVTASSPNLPNYNGWYLLQDFNQSPDGIHPGWRYASFSLKAVRIGDLP